VTFYDFQEYFYHIYHVELTIYFWSIWAWWGG